MHERRGATTLTIGTNASLVRKLAAAFGVLVFMVVGTVVTGSTAASAHTVCSGSLIDTYHVRTSGTGTGDDHYATIQLYYSSADGGTNCASLEKVRWHDGTSRNDMYLEIGLCNFHGCPRPPESQLGTDHSPEGVGYRYYAGPVSRSSAANRCVYLSAHMWSDTDGDHSGTKASRTVSGVHGPGCPND
jgi:hypothetical protein